MPVSVLAFVLALLLEEIPLRDSRTSTLTTVDHADSAVGWRARAEGAPRPRRSSARLVGEGRPLPGP